MDWLWLLLPITFGILESVALVTGKLRPLTHWLVRLPKALFVVLWIWLLGHVARRWR